MEGKICWDLYIDCLVVCSDGNLLDALGAAIKVVFLHMCLYIYNLVFFSFCQDVIRVLLAVDKV